MLVLSRKVGERVIIADGAVELVVLRTGRTSVKVGIVADRDIPVRRAEVEAPPADRNDGRCANDE